MTAQMKRKILNGFRTVFNLPVSSDPRWRTIQSTVFENEPLIQRAHGSIRVKSITRIGSDAQLARIGIPLIDNLKNLLSFVFIRIPSAINTWEVWLTTASYGNFFEFFNFQESFII
jgi:hypothetical protein